MTTLMVCLTLLSLAAAGFSLGVLVSEWRQRKAALKDVADAKAELRDLLAKVGSAHNSLGEELKAVHDRLNTLELKLSARGPK